MIFADLALARRLEAAEGAACLDTSKSVARLHPEIATAAEEIAGGWAVFTGAGSPISEARGLGMNGPVSDGDMDRLASFYHSRNDAVRVEVCPLADASLHQQVAQRGYRLLEFSNMLARPLSRDDVALAAASNGSCISTRPLATGEGPNALPNMSPSPRNCWTS